MRAKTGLRMKAPSHPGAFVRLMVLEPLGLSVAAAARALGVTRAALSALVNCRAALSLEMAIRLEKAFDLDMETLMAMQGACDLARAQARAGDVKVARYVPGGREPPVDRAPCRRARS